MAFEIEDTLKAIVVHLRQDKQHLFKRVLIGEPKTAPSERFTAAVWLDSIEIPEVVLAETIEVYTVFIRIYDNMTHEPQADVEIHMGKAAARVVSDLAGDFTLGGTIRNIDVAGQYGPGLGSRFKHLEVGGTMFRICDVRVPMIVDGSAILAA